MLVGGRRRLGPLGHRRAAPGRGRQLIGARAEITVIIDPAGPILRAQPAGTTPPMGGGPPERGPLVAPRASPAGVPGHPNGDELFRGQIGSGRNRPFGSAAQLPYRALWPYFGPRLCPFPTHFPKRGLALTPRRRAAATTRRLCRPNHQSRRRFVVGAPIFAAQGTAGPGVTRWQGLPSAEALRPGVDQAAGPWSSTLSSDPVRKEAMAEGPAERGSTAVTSRPRSGSPRSITDMAVMTSSAL